MTWIHRMPGPAAALLLAAACGGSAADHEALGDRAYVAARFEEALAEYRLAERQRTAPGRIRAKTAAAAVHVGDFRSATEQYVALGREDAQRVSEATDGLERVARAALEANDPAGVRLAVVGLRELAAHRALGTFAHEIAAALGEGGDPGDAADVLPFAAAAAPDAGAQDSLMYEYGRALRRQGRCVPAMTVFESLARRQRVADIAGGAAHEAAACALALGRRALDRSEPATAEEWFRRAVTHGGDSPIGRAAYVGLGDVMFARGDFVGAVEAFQRALAGAAAGDSIAAVARERLNMIGDAGTVFPR